MEKDKVVKILIVDDEEAAGNILKILIGKYIAAETDIRYCDTVRSALEVLKDFEPSLLMLDIEMPKLNGFDLLNMATDNHFDVIFTTAYDHYAIKAIRFCALDYLLKPIDVLDLQNAINRHIIRQQNNDRNLLVDNLLTNLQEPDSSKFKLALSTTKGVFFYEANEILYCEGENNYTRFTFSNGKQMLVSKTLKEYEDILSDYGFLRIHKSSLVNLKYVLSLHNDGMINMKDGKQLRVSKRKKEAVKTTLKDN